MLDDFTMRLVGLMGLGNVGSCLRNRYRVGTLTPIYEATVSGRSKRGPECGWGCKTRCGFGAGGAGRLGHSGIPLKELTPCSLPTRTTTPDHGYRHRSARRVKLFKTGSRALLR